MSKININLKVILVILPILSMINCNDSADNTGIPDVPVNKTINMDLPSYSNLININGYVVIGNAGYKGIIVYHNGSDEFIAIERACTYNTSDDCAVVSVDNSATFIRCGHYASSDWISCCDSKFTMDGYAILNGPAKYPLKHYQVFRSGNILTITN